MPLLSWLKRKDEKGEEQIDVDLSEETKKKLDAALKANEDITAIKQQLNGLNDIQAWVADQKKEKEAAAAAAARKAQEGQQSQTEEELNSLIITDPAKAISLGTRDQQTAILMLRADTMKRDVFEDQEKFPYYTGEVKSEIDKLLSIQSIQARNDPSVIENCYYTVVGKKTEAIREGKLKSRFAASGATRGTSSGAAGAGTAEETPKLEINDDIRHAARIAGMTPEDYAKMCYDQGVGYV